ncbi:sugar ABC transporter ATP-binding protein [Clostridiaceae bacterium 35-E11]
MCIPQKESKKVLQTLNISKSFPGVKALSDVSFELHKGEIYCIVGENGAGKSTFIKILTGALKPDKGQIWVADAMFDVLNPYMAQKLGIQVIYQENILVRQMSIAENIFVGREKTNRFGCIDYGYMMRETQKIIESFDIHLDPKELVENLSVADQQYVKIIKALALEPKVLIMDEPTTMFNVKDTQKILELVKNISKRGIGVIYISHHLREVAEIADRIMVLRDGQVVNTYDNTDKKIDLNLLTKEMVGRPVDLFYQKKKNSIGNTLLEIKNLKLKENTKAINFKLREGEILGIAGMVGSGRTEIARAIFGADKKMNGELIYKNKSVKVNCPKDAIKMGLGFITEDRQKTGLALNLTIAENTTIVGLDKFKKIFLDIKNEINIVKRFVDKLGIKTPSLHQIVKLLSGGNQQKVVLSKWLFKDVEILILDEPTRGIDVNAKSEIYHIMSEFVQQGKSIIMISSDMPELISMSDRILVVKNGELSAEIWGKDITEENIISNAIEVNG